MPQVGNTENRFGGEFMIQDRDHLGDNRESNDGAQHNRARQSDQSQTRSGQQGAGDYASTQQGNAARRQSR